MKKIIICILLVFHIGMVFSQNYNQEKNTLTNYLIRMYENNPFEGIRIVKDYENDYLISVLLLDKNSYATASQMNRVASVKAMAQASRFFNGSSITSNLIIRTSEHSDGSSETELIETINENSFGYINELEELANFSTQDNKQVFIFYKQIN